MGMVRELCHAHAYAVAGQSDNGDIIELVATPVSVGQWALSQAVVRKVRCQDATQRRPHGGALRAKQQQRRGPMRV
jgi:hypothetical protein